MSAVSQAFTFACADDLLVAILTRPPVAAACGVLVVVGGPQYRAGSHRQFALLARHLAEAGIATMRFDHRGMGDSTGAQRGFEDIADDIRAAVDAFFERVPELRHVALWALCDGASAALLYAPDDARVRGLALLNPWMTTPQGHARALLASYYCRRLLSVGAWRRLASGRSTVAATVKSLTIHLRGALSEAHDDRSEPPLDERMADALRRYPGEVLLVLAGQDLTAREFAAKTGASPRWRRLLAAPRVTQRAVPAATHTFSRRDWRDEVAALTAAWMRPW